MTLYPVRENEAFFSKINISNILDCIFESCVLLTTSVLLAVEEYFAYQVKGIDVLYKKFKVFRQYFEKNAYLLIPFSLLKVK